MRKGLSVISYRKVTPLAFTINYDGFVKSPNFPFFVIPAQAGIQGYQVLMNIQSRVTEGFGTFYDLINY